MKRYYAFLMACCCSLTGYAQVGWAGSSLGNNLDNPTYAGVKGTPYIPLAFGTGYCVRMDGTKDTLLARLDTHLQHIEIFNQKTGKVSLRQGIYQQCQLDVIDEGLVLYRTGFPANGKLDADTWYQVLYDGKTKLLKHRATKIQNDCYEYGGIRQPCFSHTDIYYVQGADKQLVMLEKGEQLWPVFGLKQAEMEAVAKQKRLKVKRWDHVAQLLQTFDSL